MGRILPLYLFSCINLAIVYLCILFFFEKSIIVTAQAFNSSNDAPFMKYTILLFIIIFFLNSLILFNEHYRELRRSFSRRKKYDSKVQRNKLAKRRCRRNCVGVIFKVKEREMKNLKKEVWVHKSG